MHGMNSSNETEVNTATQKDGQQVKVIHLAQMHALPSRYKVKLEADMIAQVLKSQFALIQHILCYKNTPVLVEGLSNNRNSDRGSMEKILQPIFPEGIPLTLDKFTPLQRDYLYQIGAPCLLYFLGKIDAIYRSIHPNAAEVIHTIFDEREKEAMLCIEEVASLGHTCILLVYGAGHDFSPYCAERGYQYERIETSDAFSAVMGSTKTKNNTIDLMQILATKSPIFSSVRNSDLKLPNLTSSSAAERLRNI